METSPLLKAKRAFGGDGCFEDHGGDPVHNRGGQAQAFSRAAVFAVFFFPALGGLLFG